MNFLNNIFKLKEHDTTINKEILAGLTTFFTMSYLFVLIPKLTETAGGDFASSLTGMIAVIFTGCLLTGFLANKPYIIAPFLGAGAFIAFTATGVSGFSFTACLTAVFVSGILLMIMSLSGLREYIFQRIPENIKTSFCTGLGLFLIGISLQQMHIVTFSQKTLTLVSGNLTSFEVLAGIFCFLCIIVLTYYKISFAVILSIILTYIAGIIFGDISLPHNLISIPTYQTTSFLNIDFSEIGNLKFLPVLFLIFMLANIETTGSVAGLLFKTDEKFKTEKDIKKVMISDSLTIILAPLIGITTSGTYLDSLTGMNAGGKTGLTALTCGILFVLGIFFTPIISTIPAYAYSPAILYVGMLMTGLVKKIDFEDITEAAPAVFTIAIMMFTQNIGLGIMSAFITYPVIKLLTGKKEQTNPILWSLFVISCIFFTVYPY